MNAPSMKFYALPVLGFLIMAFMKVVQGQSMAPSPAAAALPPSSESITIDQGIAYVLLLVALAVTYLFH